MMTLWTSKRWEKDTRYYEAHLKEDLFGWVVVRNWGSKGQSSGRQLTLPVRNPSEGGVHMNKIEQRRNIRGYTPK